MTENYIQIRELINEIKEMKLTLEKTYLDNKQAREKEHLSKISFKEVLDYTATKHLKDKERVSKAILERQKALKTQKEHMTKKLNGQRERPEDIIRRQKEHDKKVSQIVNGITLE